MVASSFSDPQIMLLISLIKDHHNVLYARFSSTISKANKTDAWEAIRADFLLSLSAEQEASYFSLDKLKKKWENIVSRLPAYIKAKNDHVGQTGRGPFPVKKEMEACWDVVGRDNPKFVKPSHCATSTSLANLCDDSGPSTTDKSETNVDQLRPASLPSTQPPMSSTTPSRKRPYEVVDATPPPKEVLSSLLLDEKKNTNDLHILRLQYIQQKIDTQRAKQNYYLAKKQKLDNTLL